MKSLRLAHLSDLHFSHVTFNPNQFLTKRWIGNFNLLFFRQHCYRTEHLFHLSELFDSLNIEHVCITGDFTSLALDSEFAASKRFVDSLSQPVCYLPGNHDCYIKEVEKTRRFYDFFPSEGLKNRRVEKKLLGRGWWWVGLDCACATPPFYALGRFYSETEKELERILDKIPEDDCVIIGNHFPLFPTNHPTHDLERVEELQKILKAHSQVKLYLHGHDHNSYIKDETSNGLPLVFNSGSVAHKSDGAFYLFDLYKKECFVERFLFQEKQETFSWVIDWKKQFVY